MALTVSQVARLAKVSIRALHHYDELGLLRPSDRSEAGYRLYSQADLLAAGTSAASAAAMGLAEAHRRYLGKWFYACPPAMHRGLGEMYVADTRFTETIDKVRPGLSLFLRDAFAANAERQGAGVACP